MQPGKPFAVAGASVAVAGGPFSLDNTVTVGQTVMLPPGSAGTGVVVLGSANNGEQRHGAAEFCRRFESGGHAGLRRLDAEWRQRASATVAVTMAYRNSGSGQQDNVKTYIFAQKIPVPPGKVVTSIVLPRQVSAGKMHVFGIGMAAS